MGGKPRKSPVRVPELVPSLVPFAASKPALTHFDSSGHAHMVGISDKAETVRVAVATGRILMDPATAKRISTGSIGKGDVLGIARVAAIQGLKRTAELIPLCHPLRITGVDIDFSVRTRAQAWVSITARVQATDRTGVEMEAMTAVSVAALTIYDMCKSIDRAMSIERVRLESKSGGKSGAWWRDLA